MRMENKLPAVGRLVRWRLIWLAPVPAVSGHRVFPEELFFGHRTFGRDIVAHNGKGFLVGCMVVAIGPVAGVQDVIFVEDIPELLQPVVIKARRHRSRFLAARERYHRQL
jgi:hypothetical protein